MTTDRPTITPDPDRDGVILHLPEITHLDTQVWAADVGLTTEGLAALRAALGVPADRAALRDRIAEAALSAVEAALGDTLVPAAREEALAGIVAVLPPPADRAAVLREAAEALDNSERLRDFTDDHMSDIHEAANELRRMADETPAAETHPAEHTWAAELYDPLAEEWVPGTRYRDRDRAVHALEHGRRVGPTWKDGTPTQRRLVRATTTYTVEPAAGARQDGSAS